MAALPDNWWPDFIPPLTDAELADGDHVTVAEIVQPTGEGSYRQVYTALAPPAVADRILATPGGIGYEISASGPHPGVPPDAGPGGYDPRFWIFGGESAPDGLEPLVVAWRSADRTLLRPDQGFLMTYGLVPREIRQPDGTFHEHWDDNETPKPNIVISRPISVHEFPTTSPAWVRIQREYLEDYAFLRGSCLLRVAYGHADGLLDAAFETVRGPNGATIKAPALEMWIRPQDDFGRVHIRYWVAHMLLRPERSPVTGGAWDYGNLMWPGIAEPLQDPHRMPLMDYVFVRDAVLGEYEGRTEEGFRVFPEYGAVEYRHQWAVDYVHRVGRDLLRLEVRKLYEGCRPNVIQHWHAHAVDPPDGAALRGQPNVATRARRIVFALSDLGESLADLASLALRRQVSSRDVVGMERAALDLHGWWNAPHVEPTTRHAPLAMDRDQFLGRVMAVEQLVVEAIQEKCLRELVIALGYDKKEIKPLRSLKLLSILIRHCAVATDAGLDVVNDSGEIRGRLPAPDLPAMTPIYTLYDFRLLKAHRSERGLNEALAKFEIDPASTAAGWGLAFDRVYDATADSLERLTNLIAGAVGGIA